MYLHLQKFEFVDFQPVIMKNQQLQERLMKVISTVVQTLPTDTCAKLQLPDDEVVFPQHLKVLINVPMAGQGLHLHNDTHSLTEGGIFFSKIFYGCKMSEIMVCH